MVNINRYKNHIRAYLVSSNRFRDIHITNFVTLKMLDNVMMNSIRSGPFDCKYLSQSCGNSNVCILHFSSVYLSNSQLESLTLKIYGKIMEYIIRNDLVRWQISTCINFIFEHFPLALTVFEILTFEIFDLKKLGQGERVQHSQ